MVEIWCPVAGSRKSYQLIVEHNLLPHFLNDGKPPAANDNLPLLTIMDFWMYV